MSTFKVKVVSYTKNGYILRVRCLCGAVVNKPQVQAKPQHIRLMNLILIMSILWHVVYTIK